MNIDQFDFNLPEDLIAQQPVNPRHNSKLLSCIHSELGDFHFYDLPNLLSPGDVIVVNDTKVLKAKLIGLVNEKKLSFNLHMKNSEDQWYAFCKPAKKCRKNDKVYFSKSFKAIILEKDSFDKLKDKSVYFFGDGAQKFNDIINMENFIFLNNINPDSKFMGELSYNKFVNNQFEDLSSFEPNYIKDFYLIKKKGKWERS